MKFVKRYIILWEDILNKGFAVGDVVISGGMAVVKKESIIYIYDGQSKEYAPSVVKDFMAREN